MTRLSRPARLFLIRPLVQLYKIAMSAQVFNPNPIVFSTSKAQRTTEISPHSLWLNDDDQLQVESDDSVEPIDQEEIFGMRVYPFCSQLTIKHLFFQTSSGRSMIQNIQTLLRNCESFLHPK